MIKITQNSSHWETGCINFSINILRREKKLRSVCKVKLTWHKLIYKNLLILAFSKSICSEIYPNRLIINNKSHKCLNKGHM